MSNFPTLVCEVRGQEVWCGQLARQEGTEEEEEEGRNGTKGERGMQRREIRNARKNSPNLKSR